MWKVSVTSRFRKTCALLCSSMCMLGTGANAQHPIGKSGKKIGLPVSNRLEAEKTNNEN